MAAPKADRPEVNVPRIRSAYDGSRVRVRLICTEGEDRTRQEFKDECDINVLMARYERTGILPQGREISTTYADVSAWDFADSMQKIATVKGIFSQLDARTRARFENNPEIMLEFIADPANIAEAVKMGLIAEPEVTNERSEIDAGVAGAGHAGGAGEEHGTAGRAAAPDDRSTPGRAAAPEQAAKQQDG